MNYFLLQDLSDGDVDAIIVTTSSKEEIESAIAKVKEIEDYTWCDLIENMPKNTRIVSCFKEDKNRIYY